MNQKAKVDSESKQHEVTEAHEKLQDLSKQTETLQISIAEHTKSQNQMVREVDELRLQRQQETLAKEQYKQELQLLQEHIAVRKDQLRIMTLEVDQVRGYDVAIMETKSGYESLMNEFEKDRDRWSRDQENVRTSSALSSVIEDADRQIPIGCCNHYPAT
jgi:chromosome segregation ATPase